MTFDQLDARMRVFETAHDLCVMPGVYIVARLDGRGFTRLTKRAIPFEAPFDVAFHDLMLATVAHLAECGPRVVYAYTQSDEISLLLHRDDESFGRKTRKLNSVLAGEASACFALRLGAHACFDCRVCELPGVEIVVDYFRWRQADAARNALNAHCYWLLRKQGRSEADAHARLSGLAPADRHELLMANGVNFNDLPAWQKRGVGAYWGSAAKVGQNPQTGDAVTVFCRVLRVERELPIKEAYDAFLRERVTDALG